MQEQAEETWETLIAPVSHSVNSVGTASGAVVVPSRNSKQKLSPISLNLSSIRLR
jgi:hypothetical protein